MSNFTDYMRKVEEERLMAKQSADALKESGAGRFSRPHEPSIYHLANRGFLPPTAESEARIAEMQQPFKPQDKYPKVHVITSATLSQHRAITEQANFFHLLETKYGAIKKPNGTYVKNTYEKAIENYLHDIDQQRRKRFASIAKINEERQKQFHQKQKEAHALFTHNMGHQAKPEEPDEERKTGWWRGMFDTAGKYFYKAREYAQGHSSSQQDSEDSGNRHGRERSRSPPRQAQGGPPEMSRAEALGIMGFAADSNPSYDNLKQKFKKLALQFHPDKNIGKNAAEITKLTSKLEEMQKAFEFLKENGTSDSGRHGGGIIKRRQKRHKTSKKTRRNTRRKTRGKTRGKTHRKSNKRR
jgi:hypothetical protein